MSTRLLAPLHVPAAVLAELAVAAALLPTLLPRSPLVQAALCALVAVQVYALGTGLAALRRRVRPAPAAGPARRRAGRLAVLVPLPLVATAAAVALPAQQELARSVEVAPTTAAAQALSVVGGLALALVLVLAGRAVRAAVRAAVRSASGRVRHVGRTRPVGRVGPAWPRATALATAATTALVGVAGPSAAATSAAATTTAETTATTTDRQGRQLLGLTPTAADLTAVTGRPATDPVRVWVGVADAPSPAARAALAVARLERAGAFERDVLAVVVPTGTGWVNPASAAALELVHDGDTALAAVQYSTASSYVTYVRGTDDATRTADAVLDAVDARLHARRAAGAHVPTTVLHGESLGAIGGLVALTARPSSVDTSLWVGVPGQARGLLGRDRTALLHPEDPVAAWSPDLLWRPTATARGPWFPLVSFWQATADLLGAAATPTGYGHRYGGELVDAWTDVVPPRSPLTEDQRRRITQDVVRVAVRHP